MSTKLIIGGVVAVALLIIIVYVATRPPKGIYMIQTAGSLPWNGTNYTGGKNYADAVTAVTALGGVIPTKSQLSAAYAKTWDICSWAWFLDDADPNKPIPKAMYATHNTSSGCGGGGLVLGSIDQSGTWYVCGYGPRPTGIPDSQWCQL